MNRRWIAVAIIAVAVIGIANIIILLVLVPRWSKAANNSPSSAPPAVAQAPHAAAPVAAPPATAPVAAAPAAAVPVQGTVATTRPATVVRHHPTPPPVQAGLHLERQVVTPSGSLRIRYLRDRAAGMREITVQDAHNPANEMVLTQYKRTAWVVVSPNDDWIVLERRDKGEEGTVQLFHRVSTAPLKYEVPTELQARGANLRDQIWQSYLSDTQQDPNIDSRRVTIDATAWDPASQKITLNVSPLPTKDDRQVPMAWTCLYDVKTKQIEPLPQEAAESPAEAKAPNESAPAPDNAQSAPDQSQEGQQETAQNGDSSQAAPAADTQDLEGEKFPATREQEITVENANELDLSDIRYAIFEMYARHDAEIHDAKMKKEFEKMPWYQPKAGFSFDDAEAEFSSIEKHNLEVLRRVRDAKTAKMAEAHRPQRKAIKGEPVQEDNDGQRFIRGVLQGVSDALNNGGNP